ncbi:MAG TPA: hypothetical protein PK322_02050 [Opitutaceae bacterium]|nr:hypothetical protein [Opitutaceae bacterium]
MFLLALGVGAWLVLLYERHLLAEERAQVQSRGNGLGGVLTSLISRRQALVDGLHAFVETHGTDSDVAEHFQDYAAGLQANDSVVRTIQIFPRRGPVLLYPAAANEASAGRTLADLLLDERPEVQSDVARAVESGRLTLSQPYELRQGGLGVVARQAFFADRSSKECLSWCSTSTPCSNVPD